MVDTPLHEILEIEPHEATVQELGFQKRHYEVELLRLAGRVGYDVRNLELRHSFRRKLNMVKKALYSRQMKLF